ncbi:hypothetical protein LCGC14_1339470 [marine sediment metagenome]|uniref:Uncharacterized protein n=1 Tax=marine sediment metagenome TaxID=412755 RepID=A0A0F9L0G6_9ZZZZ|nr:hypothetical protein [Bacteroides sp.]
MPNLFDKPIAAKPMSEFTALPLQFIDQTIQRRQAKHDKARAEMDEAEDDLYGSKFLIGDAPRNLELREGYEAQMDRIVEAADGDYSRVAAPLNTLKRRIKRDLQYGELGAQTRAYQTAMKQKETMEGLYQTDKIQRTGMDRFLASISKHKTIPTGSGSYSTFQGYTPSNVTDPVKVIQDSVDEINAKFDAEGAKFINRQAIMTNVSNKLRNNPDIIRSLMENYQALGKTEQTFEQYYTKTIEAVVSDKRYQEILKSLKHKGQTMAPGTTILDVQQPRITGKSAYTGGSSMYGRALGKLLGMNATKTHDEFIASTEGKRLIEYMQKKSGTIMPKDSYLDQVKWIEDNIIIPKQSSIVIGETDPDILEFAVTSKGFLNYSGAITNKEGKLLDAKEIKSIQGSTEQGNVTRIIGTVKAGGMHPQGSYVLMSKDGEIYFQEPGDPKTLNSQSYNLSQIDNVKLTNTGELDIHLNAGIQDPKTGKTVIPRGSYNVRHRLGDKTGAGEAIILYQDGVPKFVKQLKEIDGRMQEVITKINK